MAIQCLADDCIARILDNGRQGSDVLVLTLGHSDVVGHDDDANHLSILVADRYLVRADPEFFAIAANQLLNDSKFRDTRTDDLHVILMIFGRILRIGFDRWPSLDLLDRLSGGVCRSFIDPKNDVFRVLEPDHGRY